MTLIKNALKEALLNSVSQFHWEFSKIFDWPSQVKIFDFLTNLPEEDKKQWVFDFSKNNDPDDGLIERGGGLHDNKFFFHFRPRIFNELQKYRPFFYNHPDVKIFLSKFNLYHQHLLLLFKEIMTELDILHPGYDFVKQIPKDPNEALVIRMLKYPPGTETTNGVLAKAHYDQNFASAHLYETQPGLFFGEQLDIPFVSDAKKIAFFLSSKAQVMTGGKIFYKAIQKNGQTKYEIDSFEEGLIKATKHVVLSKSQTLQKERFSVVAFFHTMDPLPEPCLENIIL